MIDRFQKLFTSLHLEVICAPFWAMPTSDQGTNFTYANANTQISGDQSRGGCVSFRANTSNVDNMLFSIGSSLKSWTGGCNSNFVLNVGGSSIMNVYGMCSSYDNYNIPVGSSVLFDGNFHQVCVSYDNTIPQLCVYLDLLSPRCVNRTNPRYNTSLGDVRVGWWPDGNRRFSGSGGGLIRSVTLFSAAINQSCVTHQYHVNNTG